MDNEKTTSSFRFFFKLLNETEIMNKYEPKHNSSKPANRTTAPIGVAKDFVSVPRRRICIRAARYDQVKNTHNDPVHG